MHRLRELVDSLSMQNGGTATGVSARAQSVAEQNLERPCDCICLVVRSRPNDPWRYTGRCGMPLVTVAALQHKLAEAQLDAARAKQANLFRRLCLLWLTSQCLLTWVCSAPVWPHHRRSGRPRRTPMRRSLRRCRAYTPALCAGRILTMTRSAGATLVY